MWVRDKFSPTSIENVVFVLKNTNQRWSGWRISGTKEKRVLDLKRGDWVHFPVNSETIPVFFPTPAPAYWHPESYLLNRRLYDPSMKKWNHTKNYRYWNVDILPQNANWLSCCPKVKPSSIPVLPITQRTSDNLFGASLLDINGHKRTMWHLNKVSNMKYRN